LSEAVLTLGLRKTCDLLVAAGARQLFGVVPQYAERLWNHALASALIAEEIARTTRVTDPSLAFLPGLFHDVGRIGFLLADDQAFAVVHQEVYAVSRVRPEVERAWYGFDHAEAGAILTEEWGLGHDQVEAIRWHHQPMQAEPRGRKLAAVLSAADAAAYALGLASGDPPPSDDEARNCLGLDAEALAQVAARARTAFDGHREIFV
jgi:HD-like signal output (HDOD) protein